MLQIFQFTEKALSLKCQRCLWLKYLAKSWVDQRLNYMHVLCRTESARKYNKTCLNGHLHYRNHMLFKLFKSFCLQSHLETDIDHQIR